MQLQQRPEPWMCLPLSFAIALNIPVEQILADVGHDGSEIVFPMLPEPLRRRCFHIQEMIRVAIARGFTVTPVELFPVLSPTPRFRHIVYFPGGNWPRFIETVYTSAGVLTGTGKRVGHATAYDHGRVYDPKGQIYEFTLDAAEANQFYVQCAWRIDTGRGKQHD